MEWNFPTPHKRVTTVNISASQLLRFGLCDDRQSVSQPGQTVLFIEIFLCMCIYYKHPINKKLVHIYINIFHTICWKGKLCVLETQRAENFLLDKLSVICGDIGDRANVNVCPGAPIRKSYYDILNYCEPLVNIVRLSPPIYPVYYSKYISVVIVYRISLKAGMIE